MPHSPNTFDTPFPESEALLAFFHQLWTNSADPFWLCECLGDDFRFLAINPAEQKIDQSFQPGMRLREIVSNQPLAEDLLSGYFECCKTGEPVMFEQRPFINGEESLFQTLLVPVQDHTGKVTHLWGTARELTPFLRAQRSLEELNQMLERRVEERTESLRKVNEELQAANRVLAQQEATDALTGLANRRHFFERANAEIARAKRYGHSLSLQMLDLDHFKLINDRFGHPAGDEVLKHLAKELLNSLRLNDLAARIGGEEFLIMLPETTYEESLLLAERIREIVAEICIPILGSSLEITVSIGVSVLEESDLSIDQVLKRADTACYQAKELGRNQVCGG